MGQWTPRVEALVMSAEWEGGHLTDISADIWERTYPGEGMATLGLSGPPAPTEKTGRDGTQEALWRSQAGQAS